MVLEVLEVEKTATIGAVNCTYLFKAFNLLSLLAAKVTHALCSKLGKL